MSVFERSARGLAVIFKKQNVSEATVILQIEYAVTIRPQNFFDGSFRKRSKGVLVIRRFDDHFVRADSVHAIKKALALAVEIALDSERWEFVGHNAHAPARCVPAAAVPSIRQNFRRGAAL